MTTTVHWRVPSEWHDLGELDLKGLLLKYAELPRLFDHTDTAYLCGLRDGCSDDYLKAFIQELIDLIGKHNCIEVDLR